MKDEPIISHAIISKNVSIVGQVDKLELIDTLEIDNTSKAIVLPYLHGLFESFTKSANSGIRGIPRLTLNKVSERSHAFLSF